MNLYRIDPAGRTDPLWRTYRRTETSDGAGVVAQRRAERLGCDVTVSRIDQHGRVSVFRIVKPNGKRVKP